MTTHPHLHAFCQVLPVLAAGAGLKPEHAEDILRGRPPGRFFRNSRRELHGRRRSAASSAAAHPRRLSAVDPWRRPLYRRHRAARSRASRAAQTSRRDLPAGAVLRASRLVHPRRCLPQRSPAAALQRHLAGACLRPRQRGAGHPRHADAAGKSFDLCPFGATSMCEIDFLRAVASVPVAACCSTSTMCMCRRSITALTPRPISMLSLSSMSDSFIWRASPKIATSTHGRPVADPVDGVCYRTAVVVDQKPRAAAVPVLGEPRQMELPDMGGSGTRR